nr:MAG TPA: hypothetical protein [Caudoviricetes sp.]
MKKQAISKYDYLSINMVKFLVNKLCQMDMFYVRVVIASKH